MPEASFACEYCGATVRKSERPTMGQKAFSELRFCSTACSTLARAQTADERFDSSYILDENGCWVWQKTTTAKGYGTFWTGEKFARAHRWSYERVNGPLGELVCRHRCDNPSCVNPSHLEPGTQAQNIGDAVSRGRVASGERAGASKLSVEQVRAIRSSKATLSEIAAEFGIAQSTASQIRNRQRWRHVE
jgi:hypothetical protein